MTPQRFRRLFARKPHAAPEEAGRSPGLEILIAAVLGFAAVLTAFAAYQTDLADYIKDGLMDGSLPAATEECEEADGDLPSAIEADAYKVKPYDGPRSS